MNNKESILNGTLELPKQIVELINSPEHNEVMYSMFQALWNNYLANKSSTSLPYWSDRFDNSIVFNKYLKHLSKAGWITTNVEPKRNWGEVELNENKLTKWVSLEELTQSREHAKFIKYRPTCTESTKSTSTKLHSGIQDTGLVREGFMKAGNTQYKFDTIIIQEYREAIELSLTKSMDKLDLDYSDFGDSANYADISKAILDYVINNPENVYTTGNSINDSRGRAISSVLSTVFNPISNKDARATMIFVDGEKGDADTVEAIYLFIAELLGIKCTTESAKLDAGMLAYINREIHDLDLTNEDDRSELHENLWLCRLYEELTKYFQAENQAEYLFTVPTELDFTASMLAIEGTLLNHYDYCDLTNVLGNELKDAWTVEGLSRKQVKAFATPNLYGSSASAKALWTKAGIEYTRDELKLINKEVTSGRFALANKFKEYIINNCKPQEEMIVKIWNEEFKVECNRFKAVADYTKKYDVYCSKQERVVSIYHTHTHQEADLKQFKRFFVTLLVHNLDSQIMNHICEVVCKMIPIHDAAIALPTRAKQIKTAACNKLNDINMNRKSILANYFKSIGIDSSSAKQWSDVTKLVNQIPEEEYKAQGTCLK